ncbi:MAG: ATP-dependent sacrificial sulfur transferase LarE [Oscillospiraceae bacterium]|nr:ATP-dependent sacrificial sulfur transferase LarE [Oscillospiraceae bacterium]
MTLQDFFAAHPRAALAYSGGVDSAYVLYAGTKAGADLRPFYVKTQFQPAFEFEDALRLCRELDVEPRILRLDALAKDAVAANGPDRCYHCKTRIMSAIRAAAREEGLSVLLDGTNASDAAEDRPGMRALQELEILSPLRLCGLTKPEIRRLSREAGLFTWSKPAYACLATRIRTGEPITEEKLRAVEESEDFLFSLGFSDFRVRTREGKALLQFPAEQLSEARAREAEIRRRLAPLFSEIRIDPEGRRTSL